MKTFKLGCVEGLLKDVKSRTLRCHHAQEFTICAVDTSHLWWIYFWKIKRWRICVRSELLSGIFWLVFNKVNVTDPEVAIPCGLYVYRWIGGMDIKGDFVPQFCVQFLYPGVAHVSFYQSLVFCLFAGILHRSREDSKLPTTRLKRTESW